MSKKITLVIILILFFTTFQGFAQECSPVDAVISAEFTYDGSGDFCWESSCLGDYINSWGVDTLTINGTDYTNTYASSGQFPATINGKYYIRYIGYNGWSHLELRGSCGSTPTDPPETPAPTDPPTTPDPTNPPTVTDPPTPTPTNPPVVTDPPATPEPGGDAVSCAGCAVWNSMVTYNDSSQYVQYNCNLYKNNFFAYDKNPEEYSSSQWDTWLYIGPCSDDCVMGEGPFIGCGDWDKWYDGDYTIFNNIWGGDSAGEQCIVINSFDNWSVTAEHPETSGVKSYPNTSIDVDKSASSLGNFTSSFNVSVPSSGSYAATYDIWANGHAYEIMIWMSYRGAVGPIAGSWNDDGVPQAEDTNVSLGGHTFNVYKGNIGFTVISFLRTSNTTSATIDIGDIVDYIRGKGWFGDVMFDEAQFGFEITSAPGGLDFAVNSYSISF